MFKIIIIKLTSFDVLTRRYPILTHNTNTSQAITLVNDSESVIHYEDTTQRIKNNQKLARKIIASDCSNSFRK